MKTLNLIMLNILLCTMPLAMGTYVMNNISISQPKLI